MAMQADLEREVRQIAQAEVRRYEGYLRNKTILSTKLKLANPAKGTLLVADGLGGVVELPVGSDGQGLYGSSGSSAGVKWTNGGGARAATPALVTATFTSAALGIGADSAAIISLAVTGDNATAVWLELSAPTIRQTGGTNGQFSLFVWDGTIGTTAKQRGIYTSPALNSYIGPVKMGVSIPAFSGSKTFNVAVRNESGAINATYEMLAAATSPITLRATWDV